MIYPKQIYYPFANLFGNVFVLQEKLENGFKVLVEKNEGFGGSMSAIVTYESGNIDIQETENTLNPKDEQISIDFIKKNFNFMNTRAQERAEGKVVFR